MKFEIQDVAGTEEAKYIQHQLKVYNHENVCPDQHRELLVVLKDDDGKIVGGLVGSTNWSWLYVRLLWVDESKRGQGIGAKLLNLAEKEALQRDCKYSWIDTFNPKALKTYQEGGYIVFGKLDDFPPNRTRFFLKKKLVSA